MLDSLMELKRYVIDHDSFSEYEMLLRKSYVYYTTKTEFFAHKKHTKHYIEKHHILPKCLAGTNDFTNLIWLSAEDHYIAHVLLWKMTKHDKLCFALNQMTRVSSDTTNIKSNSMLYAEFREHLSKVTSDVNKKTFSQMSECKRNAWRSKLSTHSKGKIIVRNKLTRETKQIPREEFDSLIYEMETTGRKHKKTTREKIARANTTEIRGKAYHNPTTKEIKYFNSSEVIPDGFIYGSGIPNKHTKGTKFYHNTDTGETKRFSIENVPDGWISGRFKFDKNPFKCKIVRQDILTRKTILVERNNIDFTIHHTSTHLFMLKKNNINYITSSMNDVSKFLSLKCTNAIKKISSRPEIDVKESDLRIITDHDVRSIPIRELNETILKDLKQSYTWLNINTK